MKMTKDKIIEQLKSKGIKPTLHRIGVMEVVTKLMTHPTAEEIFEEVKIDYPTISLATVYNTLEVLEQQSIIKSLKHNNAAVRYDFPHKQHFHLFSKNNQEIIDYSDDKLYELLKDYFAENQIEGYSIQDIKLEIIIEKK
jgi:Fur family peroxide stress response transcriptional regulator